jgi:carbamoyltransferase
MTSSKFHDLFGGPPRESEARITQREMDLAASIQKVTEVVMLRLARHVRRETGLENVCLAGGVALNCVANGLIEREKIFKRLWIQPAAGDAGGALGAALYAWYQLLDKPRTVNPLDSQQGSYLGPHYDSQHVRGFLDTSGAVYEHYPNEDNLCRRIAELLDQGKILGHVSGRMEFGPRALGHRSIIGDARNTKMQAAMNVKVKFRESFRPFAPSCLLERTGDYFEMDCDSPYMLLVAPVREARRKPLTEAEQQLFGIEKLNTIRSDLPAITHVDYSARVQTVRPETSPRYYKIIKAFEERTGYGVIVNTSFNIRGEPIVCKPEEAYRCFMFTDMDALVLEDCICLKEQQPPMSGAEEYKAQFKLD